MLSIKKLTLSELAQRFEVLTEEECLELLAGWNCFSYCLDYLGYDGNLFNQSYSYLYGDIQSSGGANSMYIENVLSYIGIPYSTPSRSSDLSRGDIVTINNNSHAVIYDSMYIKNGKVVMKYYEPQTSQYHEYIVHSEVLSAVSLGF